jgi:hypothetical protein
MGHCTDTASKAGKPGMRLQLCFIFGKHSVVDCQSQSQLEQIKTTCPMATPVCDVDHRSGGSNFQT